MDAFLASVLTMDNLLLFLLGLVVAILSGFFGVGGGFLVTPTLNLLGFAIKLKLLSVVRQ